MSIDLTKPIKVSSFTDATIGPDADLMREVERNMFREESEDQDERMRVFASALPENNPLPDICRRALANGVWDFDRSDFGFVNRFDEMGRSKSEGQ